MCDKKDCYFINLITLNDEDEKVIIHYDRNGNCIFIQHGNPKEDIFREFEPKN